MDKLEILLARIDKFSKDRDWDQFHTPSNLAKSIAIEAGELLECFQWSDEGYDMSKVKDELADVLNYCLQLSLALNLDPIAISESKMDKNERKYPVEKAKGVAKKYDEL